MRTMEESIEQKAQERADRKLQYIIGRYGDANGERRKPYYREQLIQEAKAALSWEVFSLAFMELCKENAPVTPTKASEVSTDLKVTVHDYPEGMLETQNRQLCELIGDGCDMIENVMPKRLYRELGHTTTVLRENSKCVSMLVDEEFLFRNGLQPNLIGCYLYETDKHRSPIMGNILFVGNAYVGDGVEFTGIEPETFETLHKQLKNMAMAMKAHKEALGV